MKLCVFLFVSICAPAVFASYAGGVIDVLLKREENCATVSGVSFADIETVRKNSNVPDNAQMNRFAQCMMQQYNVIDADGKVNQDTNTYTIMSDVPDVSINAAKKCKSQTGRDDLDTARNVMNCFLQHGQMIMSFAPRNLSQ